MGRDGRRGRSHRAAHPASTRSRQLHAPGAARALTEGGYETSPTASYVAPEVEEVRMAAMRRLLQVK